MGLLDDFERGLERVVGGAFAKTFKSGLQPLEITAALRRELDTKAAVVARDRILVPNSFVVRLNPDDEIRMNQLGKSLIDELVQLTQQHATQQRYAFAGPLSIRLKSDPGIGQGTVRVDSSNVQGEVAWTPVLDVNGKRYPIVQSRTTIGRSADADVTIDDTGASRKHAEVLWDGKRAQVSDLGSTNGTKLDGARITVSPLQPEQGIEIGRTRIVFRVLAQSADVDQYADRRTDRGR